MPKSASDMDVQIHAVDHCNLNCRGCDAFAPLVNNCYADIEVIKNDLQRLSELTNGEIGTLTVSGGEPLQNHMLPEILDAARMSFPGQKLKVITNGILLEKAPDEFWKSCKKNDATIALTLYPIAIDVKKINDIAASYGVRLVYQDDTDIRAKTLYSSPLDPLGKQDTRVNYKLCFMANKNIVLENGRMYTCPTIAHIKYINEAFHQNFAVSESDYIDIYKAESFKEISGFLRKPMPFCRYCDKKRRVSGLQWEKSKGDITEWIYTP